MDDKEKYGIELETKYDKFQKGFSTAERIAEKFSQKIEKVKQNTSKALNTKTTLNTQKLSSSLEKTNKDMEQYHKNMMQYGLAWNNAFKQDIPDQKKMPQYEINISVKQAELNVAKSKLNELMVKYNEMLSKGETRDSAFAKLNYDIAKAKEKIKELNEELKETNRLEETTGNSGSKMGRNIEKGLTKSTSTIKRFALSLFGIHSIWRLISRASSEAMATNEYQTSRLSVTWNALGQIMVPIIEKLITGFQYIAIAIAKVIQLFTGYNALAKTTTKNIQSTTNAVKNMAKSLGGFDELTNIDTEANGTGLASGLKSDLNALAEFQKKIKQVEEFMEKSGITNALIRIKEALKIFWTEVLEPLWTKTLSPMLKWLLDHPNVLATVFSIFLGGKLVAQIGKLLGSASAGTGLLGLNKVLLSIAEIGVIAVTVYITKKAVEEAVKGYEKMAEASKDAGDSLGYVHKKQNEIIKQSSESIKSGEKVAENFNLLTESIKGNTDSIDGNIKAHKDRTFWDSIGDAFLEMIDINDGYTSSIILNTQMLKNNANEIMNTIDEVNELRNANKLSDDQQKLYIETIKNTIEKLKEQRGQYTELDSEYDYLTEAIGKAEDSLKFFNGELNYSDVRSTSLKDKLNIVKDAVNNLGQKWKETQFPEKTLKVKTAIETIVTGISNVANNISNALKKAFSSIGLDKIFNNKIISNIFGGLNSYDVGTNYVPSDQLAYVHKGEAIIPKEFNSSEFFGRTSNEEVVSAIRDLQQTLENKDMNAYISKDAIGKTSVDYINQQHRIKGRSVI